MHADAHTWDNIWQKQFSGGDHHVVWNGKTKYTGFKGLLVINKMHHRVTSTLSSNGYDKIMDWVTHTAQ